MNAPIKQHLIDPEICIRCYTCEEACPAGAITHDENNVVVNAASCDFCMACISPCPTGSIDNWRAVRAPYSVEDQLGWVELPPQEDLGSANSESTIEALDETVAGLLAEAHSGAGGVTKAPTSASKPSVNLYNAKHPALATVQGNYRLTSPTADSDVRHIIIDLGGQSFPILEGQSVGVLAPGADARGNPHTLRLYSVSSPRDGERPNTNNLSLTVKREEGGVCSNYLCDLQKGDQVNVVGPFGTSFLMPNDPQANIIMICTGTGAAPFRAFTMRRQRTSPESGGKWTLFFGARTVDALPYFGPLNKVPDTLLEKHLVFSRAVPRAKEYVQDRMLKHKDDLARLLKQPNTYVYLCGLKAMEGGVEAALRSAAEFAACDWSELRDTMRSDGRYHVETY
ncbi:MAG: benzoyl-CoA 2,3-epoxidase subunit BoxA [Propylenella sp.]